MEILRVFAIYLASVHATEENPMTEQTTQPILHMAIDLPVDTRNYNEVVFKMINPETYSRKLNCCCDYADKKYNVTGIIKVDQTKNTVMAKCKVPILGDLHVCNPCYTNILKNADIFYGENAWNDVKEDSVVIVNVSTISYILVMSNSILALYPLPQTDESSDLNKTMVPLADINLGAVLNEELTHSIEPLSNHRPLIDKLHSDLIRVFNPYKGSSTRQSHTESQESKPSELTEKAPHQHSKETLEITPESEEEKKAEKAEKKQEKEETEDIPSKAEKSVVGAISKMLSNITEGGETEEKKVE